jgi:hypothetical protein
MMAASDDSIVIRAVVSKRVCEAAELLELADPVGPIRFDTTREPMRKKSRPKAASAIRYLKISGEASANPCSSVSSNAGGF